MFLCHFHTKPLHSGGPVVARQPYVWHPWFRDLICDTLWPTAELQAGSWSYSGGILGTVFLTASSHRSSQFPWREPRPPGRSWRKSGPSLVTEVFLQVHTQAELNSGCFGCSRCENIVCLSSGFMPRVIKVAPACAIMISTYEFGKAFFQKMNLDRECTWTETA